MKTSRSTEYALLAAAFVAKNYKNGSVLSQKISAKYNIPLEYLLKILQQLVRANVLRSKRGPNGGFKLARPASEITMLQIIEAVDGPMVSQMRLTEQTNNEPFSIKMEAICAGATKKASDTYANTTLAEVLS